MRIFVLAQVYAYKNQPMASDYSSHTVHNVCKTCQSSPTLAFSKTFSIIKKKKKKKKNTSKNKQTTKKGAEEETCLFFVIVVKAKHHFPFSIIYSS